MRTFITALVVVAACSASKPGGILYVDPAVYPCGINDNYCNGPGHPFPCCIENSTCGGAKYDHSCPENECCFVGASFEMKEDAGPRHGTPMRLQ
jgi:hypothetical protein